MKDMTNTAFQLVPEPKKLTVRDCQGLVNVWRREWSSIDVANKLSAPSFPAAEEFGFAIEYCGVDEFLQTRGIGCDREFDRTEGYFLDIGDGRVVIAADNNKAVFYAVQTLAQLMVSSDGADIPALTIEDWPDLGMRCFNVCYHTAVPNMPSLTPNFRTLLDLVELYSHIKMNAMLFEPEAMFPYEKYPQLSNSYAFTRDEIKLLKETCAKRHVEIIPLLQSLGHAYQVLRHVEFAHLREVPDTSQQYCPCSEAVPEFYSSLAGDIIEALGPVKRFHLGGDESRRLGVCPSCRRKLAEKGMGALYGDHMNKVAAYLTGKGVQPLIWADIAEEHPEILDVLDPDIGLVFWNYDMVDWRPYVLEQFTGRGRTVIGACAAKFGAHSDYMFLYKKAMRNISLMASECRRNRLEGMLVTDWVKLAPNEAGIIANCYGAHLAWSFHNDQEDFGLRFSSLFFGTELREMDEIFRLLSETGLKKKDVLNNYWAAPYSDQNEGFMPDWLDRYDWSGRDFTILMKKYANQESLPAVIKQLEETISDAEKALACLEKHKGKIQFKKHVYHVLELAGRSQHLKCSAGLALSKAVRLLKYPSEGDTQLRMAAAEELERNADKWPSMRKHAYDVLIEGTFRENLEVCLDFKFDPSAERIMRKYAEILRSGRQLQGLLNYSLYPERTEP